MNCYSRLLYGIERKRIKPRYILPILQSVIEARFENLLTVTANLESVTWNVTGIHWINWLRFSYRLHRSRFMWEHHPEIVVTEWVSSTIAHKVVRIINKRQNYRDGRDDYCSPANFDVLFPTLECWIEQLYADSDVPAAMVLDRAKNATPDCFWKNIETPDVPPLLPEGEIPDLGPCYGSRLNSYQHLSQILRNRQVSYSVRLQPNLLEHHNIPSQVGRG
jgi:hypothetical protein